MTVLRLLRVAAATAAILLAVLSRGDAIVLALLLAAATWRPLPLLAIGTALAATSWRWGSTSLEAWSGAQAVLGPGGWVGPAGAAASSWLAALAVLLAATRPLEVGGMAVGLGDSGAPNLVGVVLAAAAGVAAAVVVVGPAPGGAIAARAVAAIVAVIAALGLSMLRARAGRGGRALDSVAAVSSVAALVLASVDAPPWGGTADADAFVEGLALALAAAALTAVAMAAMGARRA